MATTEIEVTEQEIPATRLAAAVWMAMTFSSQIVDLIISEDYPVQAKTSDGLVTLAQMKVPDADFAVTREDFMEFAQAFFAADAGGAMGQASAEQVWDEVVQPTLDTRRPVNRSVRMAGGRFMRVSISRHSRGKLIAFARITNPPRELSTLNLSPAILKRLETNPTGTLIITGTPAAGKTATALSILEHFNEHNTGSILTVEDPIEYFLTQKGCSITQREVGEDVNNFGDALHDALRQSASAILVGEVRDREGSEAALLAGASGSLVIITTHGLSVEGALRRILAFTNDASAASMRSVLAGSLIGVIRQTLIPYDDGSGWGMVSEALHGTDTVRQHIERGEFGAIRNLTLSSTGREDFYSMRDGINELVRSRHISLVTADRYLKASSHA